MRAFYCSACGKRIPQEELDDDSAVVIEGELYCGTCADAVSPEIPQVEAEPVPEGPIECDRCKAIVEMADIASGKAISAGGMTYCTKCTKLYMPLIKALKEKEEHVKEDAHPQKRRTPAYGMPAVTTDHYTEGRMQPYEKKSSLLPVIGIAAGVVLLIIIIAVAMSGGNSRPENSRTPARPGASPSISSPPPVTQTPSPRPSFTENPQVKIAIEKAVQFAKNNPKSFDAIIKKYEDIERAYNLSLTQSAHVQKAMNETLEKQRHEAQETRDKLLAKANELEKKGNYEGAIKALKEYPDSLKSALECWNEIRARIETLEKDAEAKPAYEELVKEVEGLKKEESEVVALQKMKDFQKKYAGSSFADKAEKIATELSGILEKRKEEKERALKEEAEKEKLAVEKLKESKPLYYAHFDKEKAELNTEVKYGISEYPYKTPEGGYAFRFFEVNAFISFDFDLTDKPDLAILKIEYMTPKRSDNVETFVELDFVLNDNIFAQRKRFTWQMGQIEEVEFNITSLLLNGKNKLEIKFPQGTVRWQLHKMELRTRYKDEAKLRRAKAEAASKTEESQRHLKEFASSLNKQEEKERKQLIRKFEKGAQSPLKPGTHNLLTNKNIKSFKIWGTGGEWKFENDALIGRNNNLASSSLLTPHFRNMHKWKNYSITIKMATENSCEHKVFLMLQYPEKEDLIPMLGLGAIARPNDMTLGTDYELKFTVENGKLNSFVNGNQTIKDHEVPPSLLEGFFGIQLGPNATMKIKALTLELKN